MMNNNFKQSSVGRRSILKTIGTTGVLAGLGGKVDGNPATVNELDETPTHDLLVRGNGDATYYRCVVSGTVSGTDHSDSGDVISDSTITGEVRGSYDLFRFTGEILLFEIVQGTADDIEILVDGNVRTLSDLNPPDVHTLGISGTGPKTNYAFRVSDVVYPTETITGEDHPGVDRADGAVRGGNDEYLFRGDVTSFTVPDGSFADIDVFIDDDRKTLAELNDARTLLIDGTGPQTGYAFEVSDSVYPTELLTGEDHVGDGSARGAVGGGSDEYLFGGDITSFTVTDGSFANVDVFIDGDRKTLAELNDVVAEARMLTVDEPWQTYNLTGEYESPVVVAKPLSFQGSQPCHVRLRNVSSDRFEARVEEWLYMNDVHYDEFVGSLAMDGGTYELDDGISVEVGRTVTDHSWTSVSFEQNFTADPLVFCQSETVQGGQPIVTRIANVSTTGFDLRLQEEEALGSHSGESLGYIAIEPGIGTLHGMTFEAGRMKLEDQWSHLSFDHSYTNPVFLAGIQSFNGSNTASLRHQNLSATGVEVAVQEEQSQDDEMNHVIEQVGYLVLEAKTDEESPHRGETIPSIPHAPSGVTPPTGSNFHPSAATPVLRGSDVTDYGEVDYVADPFMFVENGTWHMFFEIFNGSRDDDAPIGHATSPDGLHWTYDQVVLLNRYHHSFPYVWKHHGDYYMSPPYGTGIELYKARQFPTDWQFIGNPIDVDYYSHDPSIIRYQGRWWLFTDRGNENVMVYHSTDLEREGWTPHEQNPVVTNRRRAGRQGGRPIVVGDRLFLYFQDLVENYGDAVRCYEVTDLSSSTYADREVSGSPVLHGFGSGWASRGMHTFDPWWRGPDKGWRCVVDGIDGETLNWSIGIVDIPPSG